MHWKVRITYQIQVFFLIFYDYIPDAQGYKGAIFQNGRPTGGIVNIARKDIAQQNISSMGCSVYYTTGVLYSVTDLTFSKNAITLTVGDTETLTATVMPENATDRTVIWSVGGTNQDAVQLFTDADCNNEVGTEPTTALTVYVKGISAGSATVTATSNADSEKKASCDVTVNAAQTQTEELLTTITGTGSNANPATSANVSYSVEGVATLTFSGEVYYVSVWGWWGYGITLTVTPADGYTITKCVFYDNKDNNATDSEAPFVVETAEDQKMPKVNGSYIYPYSDSAGVKKIEVYGYATPTATHSVTITAGDHMTKTTDSGATAQADLSGPMTDVVYTADNGYYFPTTYSVAAVSGISVTRDSYTQITVSGTPTADAAIALTAPTAKTTPDAPTTATATDCTTADNNDGKLTGVTTAMEYKKSDAEDWTAGTGSDITGLVPGTYYVRVKATDTTNESANQELTIAEYTAPTYTVTYKVVNGTWSDDSTTDKTETVQSGSSPASVPTGMKASSGYTGGAWDTNPAEATITGTTTFTYTFTAKQPATVTKVPETKTLTYNGSAQELVTAGEVTGGTMYYAVTTENTAPTDENLYTTSIPTATNAGTYYVWYKVVGAENYNDTEPVCVVVAISEASEGIGSGTEPPTPTSDGDTGTSTSPYIPIIVAPAEPTPTPELTLTPESTSALEPTQVPEETTPTPISTEAPEEPKTTSEPSIPDEFTDEDKIPYEEVIIDEGYIRDITGTKEATAESNPYGTKIVNSAELKSLLQITDTAEDEGVNVWLDIQDISDTISDEEKELITEAGTDDYTVALFLDATLFIKVGDNEPEKVSETNGKLKVSILIPEELRVPGRSYEIIRLHDGEATVIGGVYDEETFTFTFETDRFSAYAVAYKEQASAAEEPAERNDDKGADTLPQTGTRPVDVFFGFGLVVVCYGAIVCLTDLWRRREED